MAHLSARNGNVNCPKTMLDTRGQCNEQLAQGEEGKGVRGELRAVRVSDDLLSVLVQLAVAAATVSVRVSVTSLSQSGSWATYPSRHPLSLLHTLPLLLPSLAFSLSV